MNDSPIQTRIRLQTSFQDSYLSDKPRPDQKLLATLKEQIRQQQRQLELNKATHDFLLKQFNQKPKKVKSGFKPTVCQFLGRVQGVGQSLLTLNRLQRQ